MRFNRFATNLSLRLKRSLVVIITAMGLIGFSAPPALAETQDLRSAIASESLIQHTQDRWDDEDLIAGCTGYIENGSGELECVMPSGHYWTRIQAATGYNNGIVGTVECFVKFPDGEIEHLGIIPSSNGATEEVEFYFCPYGTYKFIYLASTHATLDVAGFILG